MTWDLQNLLPVTNNHILFLNLFFYSSRYVRYTSYNLMEDASLVSLSSMLRRGYSFIVSISIITFFSTCNKRRSTWPLWWFNKRVTVCNNRMMSFIKDMLCCMIPWFPKTFSWPQHTNHVKWPEYNESPGKMKYYLALISSMTGIRG